MGDSPQEQGNPEHTAQPAGNSTAWRVSFDRTSVGPTLCQEAPPIGESSVRLVSSQNLCSSAGLSVFLAAGLCSFWQGGTREIWSVSGSLKLFLLLLRSREDCFDLGGEGYTTLAPEPGSALHPGSTTSWMGALAMHITSLALIFFICRWI